MKFTLRIILLIIIFPIIIEILIFSLITPKSFDINFKNECKDQSNECRTSVNTENLSQVLLNLKSKIEDLERIGEISFISPKVFRFDLVMTNNSLASFRISNPPKVLPAKTSISCGNSIFLYGQSLTLKLSSNLEDISSVINNVANQISTCTMGDSQYDPFGEVLIRLPFLETIFAPKVAPGGIVTFDLKDFEGVYRVEFIPDWKGRIILFVILLFSMFPLLPALREGYRFCKKGVFYFTKE